MFCSNCGKKLGEPNNYCPQCGFKLSSDEKSTLTLVEKSNNSNFPWKENLHFLLLPFTIALALLDILRLVSAVLGIYFGYIEFKKELAGQWTRRRVLICTSFAIHGVYILSILFY